MCYSAKARQDHRKYLREFGGTLAIADFIRLFWNRKEQGSPFRAPKAMEDAFLRDESAEAAPVRELILSWREEEAARIEQELFAQTRRLNEAERTLRAKVTKKAGNDQRIATDKIAKARARLSDLRRAEPLPRDERIFPGNYCTVLASDRGQRIVAPMRYQCRPVGKPAFNDGKFPGTYNARRDSLDSNWKGLFGYSHALMVVDTFYENVTGPDGRNRVLQFTPRDGSPMYVACLWSRWTDPKGVEPELLSFAAITDEPEPEVAAAGHDRTIINLKPEHVDAWLNPDPANLGALQAMFDDKLHPYYEHREAA
jgi:putative SOS response-associated peptidase YedK